MILGLISKLLLAMVGATIPQKPPKMLGIAKSPNVLLSGSAMFSKFYWFTLLYLCSLHEARIVSSISGLKYKVLSLTLPVSDMKTKTQNQLIRIK